MGQFLSTTQWSSIILLKDLKNPEAQIALANLFKKYWTPLYIYVRRKGYNVEDSQDLVQGFFTDLIEKEYLKKADKEKGRFRSFLLSSMNHYLINEWDKKKALKRGGDKIILSLDFEEAEGNYKKEPSSSLSPDKIYERQWVVSLLNMVLDKLKQEFTENGKEQVYEEIKGCMTYEDTDTTYSEIAQKLGMSEGAIKVTIHRARKRFKELLHNEIMQTVANPNEIDDEIRYLFLAFD